MGFVTIYRIQSVVMGMNHSDIQGNVNCCQGKRLLNHPVWVFDNIEK